MQTLQKAPESQEVDPTVSEKTHSQRRLSIGEMRDLVGLEPIENSSQETNIESEGSDSYQEALVDEDDFAEEADSATQRKPWQRGWPKLAIVATPWGLACLIFAIILSSVTGMKLANKNNAAGETAVIESADTTAVQTSKEAEIARLKTANALGNQASILDSQPTRKTEIRPASPQTPTTVQAAKPAAQATQPKTPAQPQAQTQTPTPRTRPVAISRAPVTPAPRPAVRRAAPAPTQIVRSQPVQAQPVSRQAPVDPFTQWQKLAAVGSYGQVDDSIDASVNLPPGEQPSKQVETSESTTIPVLVSNVSARQSIRRSQAVEDAIGNDRPLPKVMQDGNQDELAIAQQSDYPDNNIVTEQFTYDDFQLYEDEVIDLDSLGLEAAPPQPQAQKISNWTVQDEAIALEGFEIAQAINLAQATEVSQQNSYQTGVSYIMRNAQPSPTPEFTRRETVILPGVSAKGEVVAPVAWAQDIQSTAGSIELTDDLISNGSVIMPAGTQLTVALDQMSASGMMSLTVTSIVLPERGYEHMQIPAEAISIQGAGGDILMAKDVSGVDGELRRLDRNQALLGALGTVGAVLNRPNSSVNTVGVGGSASSTTYSSPNIIGAILEGSANTMIAQRAARNQQRAAELQQRPAVWVLEQGTEIEIFISEAVNIGD